MDEELACYWPCPYPRSLVLDSCDIEGPPAPYYKYCSICCGGSCPLPPDDELWAPLERLSSPLYAGGGSEQTLWALDDYYGGGTGGGGYSLVYG